MRKEEVIECERVGIVRASLRPAITLSALTSVVLHTLLISSTRLKRLVSFKKAARDFSFTVIK